MTSTEDRRARQRRERKPYGARILGRPDQSSRALRIRVQLLLTGLLVVTNVVGAAVVVLISAVVIPAPEANRATILTLAIGAPVYVVLAVLIGALFGTMTTLRALRWTLDEDARPDKRERVRVFKVPFRLTVLQFVLWAGATVAFTVLAAVVQPERALATGLTVGTAAIVVCGVAYLLTEFAMRPIAARALLEARSGDRRRGMGIRSRMIIFWCIGTGAPVVTLVTAGILTLTGVSEENRLPVITIILGSVLLVFGLLVTVLGARAVEAPVRSVRLAMHKVERGDLDAEVVVYDGTELGLLQAGFNHMAGGLQERERIRDLFGRHVGHDVAQRAASGLGEIELGGETREVSVLFVDLVGSTTYAEQHPPAEVVAMLNRFFSIIVEEVDRHGGLVNKFMGDAVLAVFGAPVSQDDHATSALAAARRTADRLAAEVDEVRAGIGVATGEVVVGNVGHEERFEYTVIGDAVNAAARITELAKEAPGGVLALCESLEAATGE
ncbi:adenylate/guanylate cyclase domain-containing protein, partial [Nocardioides pacificus]